MITRPVEESLSEPHAHAGVVLQLLVSARPALSDDALAEALRSGGHVAERRAPGTFALSTADGLLLAAVSYEARDGVAHPAAVQAAAAQTWDWPEASAVAAQARATVVVEVEPAAALDRARSLRVAQAAVGAAFPLCEVVAVHWLPSERLVSPERWQESLAHGGAPADHAINVRLFRVAGGRAGEGVMDTLGLGAFGLPDLECHFHGLDLGLVAQLLFAYAEYLFEKGDVLDADSLVRGTASHEEWECERGEASVAPPRPVVRLLPAPANRPA
jgi:hypothetical protein